MNSRRRAVAGRRALRKLAERNRRRKERVTNPGCTGRNSEAASAPAAAALAALSANGRGRARCTAS